MSTSDLLKARSKNQFNWMCRKIPRPTDEQYEEWVKTKDYNAIVYHIIPLIAYILRVHVGTYDDYLDIVQSCIVRILEVLPKFDLQKGCKLTSWLFVVIKHFVYNYTRSAAYHVSLNSLIGDSDDCVQDFLIDSSPTPHETVQRRSDSQHFYAKVCRILKPCNERDRKMMLEYIFSDQSITQADIARKYGVSRQYFSQVFFKRFSNYKRG